MEFTFGLGKIVQLQQQLVVNFYREYSLQIVSYGYIIDTYVYGHISTLWKIVIWDSLFWTGFLSIWVSNSSDSG